MNDSYSGHHNLPTHEMSLKSDNVEFVRYCGGHFENGDRYKFFNAGNQFGTSLSTHICNLDDIGQCLVFAPILKMATGRNFAMSGHHYLPTYQIWMISDNVEFLLPF